MKMSEFFPSRYMKAEDFAEGEVRVLTIRNVEPEQLGQGKEAQIKPIMSFREPDTKPLVLNKTNFGIIAKFYGDDTDDWLGKKVALHVMEVEMKGDIVQAIRVKTKAPVVKAAPPPEPSDDDLIFLAEQAPQIDVGNLGPGVKVPSKQKQTAAV